MSNYFSKAYLSRYKTSYINNALLQHNYSAFSLAILEYIDTANLSKEKSKKLILSRKQYFLDLLNPEYNKKAGSSLGYAHTEETRLILSEINKGKSLTEEHKRKISLANSAENHPLFGKSHSASGRGPDASPSPRGS